MRHRLRRHRPCADPVDPATLGAMRASASRPFGSLLALAGMLCAASCAPPPTQLIVVVDTDLQVPGELDAVSITVSSTTGVMESERQALASASTLPLTVTVIPSGEFLGPIDVVAQGGLDGSVVLTRRARVTLVRGESLMLRLHLVARCLDVSCDEDESCGESGCGPIELDDLPVWPGTPPRLGMDAGALDGGPRDGSVRDAAMRDASNPCEDVSECDDDIPCTVDSCDAGRCAHQPVDSMCDDGEGCTDDRCDVDLGCVGDPNTAACNDGSFCNGFDQCGAGTCSTHTGDPCAAPTVCDEAADRCRGCVTVADCPGETLGAWEACTWGDTCTETGTRSRTVRTYACTGGACVPMDGTRSEPCMRDTDGLGCGVGSCEGFGACSYPDTCAESGTQSRTCTDLACGSGACRTTTRSESMPCTRDTDGTACASTMCGGYGACDYASTCDEDATQSRTCNAFRCGGGSCAMSSRGESQPCSRDTDGASCGSGVACRTGSCVSCAPTLSGSHGTVGTSYLTAAAGSGANLTFTDGSAGTPMGSITVPGATFSGTATMGLCIWQVLGMGNRIRFVDWNGTDSFDVTVSGATVSGSAGPACTPGPYGCFPPCLARVAGSGSTMQLTYGDSSTGSLSFGCP